MNGPNYTRPFRYPAYQIVEPTLFQEMDAKSHCSKFTTISCRKPQAAKLEALITRLPYLNSEEAKDIDN